MASKILNNLFFPLRWQNIKAGHIIIYLILLVIISFDFFSTPMEGSRDDLYEQAKVILKDRSKPLSQADFNRRENNLWLSLLYDEYYSKILRKNFSNYRPKIPNPKYPLLSFVLKPLYGRHPFPPINLVEVASYLRKSQGSGVTIRSKDEILNVRELKNVTSDNLARELELYKNNFNHYFKIVVEASVNKQPLKKIYRLNYKDFPDFRREIEKLFSEKAILENIILYKNKETENFLKGTSKSDDENDVLIHKVNVRQMSINDVVNVIETIKGETARIYTLKLKGNRSGKAFEKSFLIRFGIFPPFHKLLADPYYQNARFSQIAIYESKVLKYKSNSREFVDFNRVPEQIRKAFILVEDDYFYFQAGGVDPIGLVTASYNYVVHGLKKGNASITEQIYEMYLGKRQKTPFDKLIQILGAVYLTYYSDTRDEFVNLYSQSIPGSFWRDHNYGVKGIVKNYLNKESLRDLSWKELAWLTRIALLPNVYGQDYVRFHLIKTKLKSYGVTDIFDDNQIKTFLEQNSPEKKSFIRLPKEVNETELDVIKKLRRSYKATDDKIVQALTEFKNGNEFIPPLISQKEYDAALKEEILFDSPTFLNAYQDYTDQTIKDLYRFAGNWSLNAGLDIEVDFDENAQQVLEKELLHSTRIVYGYRYDQTASYKRYGGGAILVKTHDIKTNKIANKIVAIASRHTSSDYFNWAVDGVRHFGSIFKWTVLLLYLNDQGTLLDQYYDIPRKFKYEVVDSKGKTNSYFYTPDNWRINHDELYGFYTFDRRDNVYNFIQSKNNTFVYLAERVGLKRLADFMNDLGGLNNEKRSWLKVKPVFPIVLGSQEMNSVRFAQINAVIANQGKFVPLTTITRIINPDGSFLALNLPERQVVSREAAEAAFYCGYVNTFLGTAKHFISGGAGKTGSSDTDVAFLAMSGRTADQYIEEKPSHLLNHNLLYLVNVGVNVGKIDEGLYGGTLGALNAREVFNALLGQHYEGKKRQLKYEISGDFTKYFSPNFKYEKLGYLGRLNGKPIMVPVPKDKTVNHEQAMSGDRISEIRMEYETRKDTEYEEELMDELASANGENYQQIVRSGDQGKLEELRRLASMQRENKFLDGEYERFEREAQDDYGQSSHFDEVEKNEFINEEKKQAQSPEDEYYSPVPKARKVKKEGGSEDSFMRELENSGH